MLIRIWPLAAHLQAQHDVCEAERSDLHSDDPRNSLRNSFVFLELRAVLPLQAPELQLGACYG